MIDIKKHSVVIELQRNDLWQLGALLINSILNESKLKWIMNYKGESAHDFVYYVKNIHHLTIKYLEEIYGFLDRLDLLESLEKELVHLFQSQRIENSTIL